MKKGHAAALQLRDELESAVQRVPKITRGVENRRVLDLASEIENCLANHVLELEGLVMSEYETLTPQMKSCGANAEGGGGFQPDNTCGKRGFSFAVVNNGQPIGIEGEIAIFSEPSPIGDIGVKFSQSYGPYPGFEEMPDRAYHQRFSVYRDGDLMETFTAMSESAEPDRDSFQDSRALVRRLKREAKRAGELVASGEESTGKESVSWRVERNGRGTFRVIVGDFYEEDGLSRKQAEKFAVSEAAAWKKENQ